MSGVKSSLAVRYSLFRFAENGNEYTWLSIYISFVDPTRTYPSFSANPLVDDGKGILVARVAQPECLTVTVN